MCYDKNGHPTAVFRINHPLSASSSEWRRVSCTLAPDSSARAGKHKWMQTATERPFDLGTWDEKQISIRDIAAALAKQCRFTGAKTTFYSVAQHSVIVTEALKKHGAVT
jgi:hypothetical protein